MNIGFDGRTILSKEVNQYGGVSHYTTSLLIHLVKQYPQHRYTVFIQHKSQMVISSQQVEYILVPSGIPYFSSQYLFAKLIRKFHFDVFHGVSNTLPLYFKGNGVVTVHDLAILHQKEWSSHSHLSYFFSTKIQLPFSLRKAKKIIAISECTKQDIIKYYRIPEQKIEVVYHGVDTMEKTGNIAEIKKTFSLQDHYILFIGTLEPRKNLVRTLQAFEQYYQEAKHPYQFVICGAKGWKYENILKEMRRITNRYPQAIKYVGYVDALTKMTLLQHAQTFIFPSLYEGFGLPVIEAMKYGVPVITSNSSSLKEIAQHSALLVDPYEVREIYTAFHHLLVDMSDHERMKLGKKGKDHSTIFSWEHCTQDTMRVYSEI